MPAVYYSTRNASSSKHNYSIVSASDVMERGAKVIAIITVDGLWMNVCCWNARAELDCCGIFLLFHLKQPNNKWTPHRLFRFRSCQRELETFKTLQQSKCAVLDVLFLFWIITVTFQLLWLKKGPELLGELTEWLGRRGNIIHHTWAKTWGIRRISVCGLVL